MLANMNKMMMEKVKSFQQQLRSRDERIVALETENAMLYLKLAQCQCQLRDSKQEATYHAEIKREDEKLRYELREKLFAAQDDLTKLRNQFNTTREQIKRLPLELKNSISFDDVIKQAGGSSIMKNLSTEHTLSTEQLQDKLLQAERARDEAMRKTNMERLRRRTLHNTLVELRGNIRVHCRVRPLLAALDSNGDGRLLGLPKTQSEKIVEVMDEETLLFNQLNANNSSSNKAKTFEYERVYKPNDDQTMIFADVAPLLTSLLDGYNVCIMAYGQTGSGKTHTMVGDHSLYNDLPDNEEEYKEGIIPRSAKEIIRLMKERGSATESYSLEISVFEVYNNEINDLLARDDAKTIKHAVFSANDGSQEIPSLVSQPVSSAREVIDYVTYGMRHRHEDSTKVHAHSSRSHLIVQLNLFQTNMASSATTPLDERSDETSPALSPSVGRSKQIGTSIPVRSRSPAPRYSRSPVPSRKAHSRSSTPVSRSQELVSPTSSSTNNESQTKNTTKTITRTIKTKLQLVDLAGSECVGMSGVTGSALRETSNINKSLSALADVLQALSENQNHIPYRNTKLTHILQDTIGGDSKLLVMLCVSPVQKYTTETSQCLAFGSRTRQVARGPAKKRRPTGFNLDIPLWSSTESLHSRSSSSSIPRASNPRR
eukprot:TCONS_00071287-protein